jgi:hypothetical protein
MNAKKGRDRKSVPLHNLSEALRCMCFLKDQDQDQEYICIINYTFLNYNKKK